MDKELLEKLISEDKYGLLNIDYEICTLGDGKEKIKAINLTEAKRIATRKGYGKTKKVWIRGFKGNLVATKEPGKKWIDSTPYFKDLENLEYVK